MRRLVSLLLLPIIKTGLFIDFLGHKIGNGLNTAIDRFDLDKPSEKPAPDFWISELVGLIRLGFTVAAFFGLFMIASVVMIFSQRGCFDSIFAFLWPVRDGFPPTAWAFCWHWMLFLGSGTFYICCFLVGEQIIEAEEQEARRTRQ